MAGRREPPVGVDRGDHQVQVVDQAGPQELQGGAVPAADPHVISVGAIGASELRARFSDYGLTLDLGLAGPWGTFVQGTVGFTPKLNGVVRLGIGWALESRGIAMRFRRFT